MFWDVQNASLLQPLSQPALLPWALFSLPSECVRTQPSPSRLPLKTPLLLVIWGNSRKDRVYSGRFSRFSLKSCFPSREVCPITKAAYQKTKVYRV